ncbi:MAG: exo-alpha-sialidase, partial [Firmicutes bacterium]|nr:exo-alpha-sialidase [Bacillota bacterium]
MLRGATGWQYRPFLPEIRADEKHRPYICRLAPFETGVEVEVLGEAGALYIREKDTQNPWREIPMAGPAAVIDNLLPDTEYELRAGSGRLRYVRTGFYPDRVVNYLHPRDGNYAFSGQYLCSPTLARVPSGAIIAGMDVYESGGPQNLTLLFRSEDGGATWRYLCDLYPAYWGALFTHRGALYLLGTSTEHGHVLIGASYDEGATWTKPVLLFPGGCGKRSCGWQRQPMPVIAHGGNIVTSIDYGSWASPTKYGIATLFARADAGLLDPASWTVSDITYYDKDWPGAPAGGGVTLLEGSVYPAAD